MRTLRDLLKVLIRELERKRQLGRNRHSWESSIKLDLKEVRCDHMDWIHLAEVDDH
jgi:hypothetical protein